MGIARVARGTLLVALLAVVALAAILQTVGFPASVTRAMRIAATRNGILLDFSRMRLDLPRGILIEKVTAVTGPGMRHARFEADSISLRPAAGSVFSVRGLELREAVVHRGRLFILEGDGPPAPPAVIQVDTMLRFDGEGIDVRRVQGSILDSRVDIRGRVNGVAVGAFPWAPWRRRPVRDPAERPAPWSALAAHLDRWTAIRALGEEIRWERAPLFRIDLDLDLDRPERNRARLRLAGGAGQWGGMPFTGMDADVEWADKRVELLRLDARLAEGKVQGGGTWCLDTDRVHARVAGEGPWAYFRTGLPRRASVLLHEARVSEQGHLRWSWAWEDVPASDLSRQGQGHLQWTDAEVDGLALPRVAFRLAWNHPRLALDEVQMRMGEGALAGEVSGHAVFDVERRHVDAEVEGGFDPAALLPWLLPQQARHVGTVVLRSQPPHARGRINGTWAQRRSLRVELAVTAADFLYNGAYVESAEADVLLDGAILSLRSLRIRRPEGELTGWVVQDLETSKAEFDVESGIAPHAVARMIGSSAHRFAQRFRFEGPAHIRARGRVQAGGGWDNAFTAEFEGSGFGMERFLAQQAVFRVSVDERTIRVEEAHGIYAGGLFEGQAAFELSADGTGAPGYDAEVRLEDADLAVLASDILREDTGDYEGRMDARLALRGRIGAGQGPTAQGNGRVEIRGAGLMRIPVLGGLSTLLGRVYPGLGFVTQDVLTAAFNVRDSRVRSDSISLQGTVISLEARGNIHFDGRLNCRAQVRLLREGIAAEALRMITFPLTRLLEFDLTGTFNEPRWRPRNFSLD